MFISDTPRFINWNFTHQCNFYCPHCYSRNREQSTEMTREQVAETCRRLAAARVFQVNLGGGEPIMRTDCVDTVRMLNEEGVRVMLSSSGWWLDQNKLEDLLAAGIRAVYISFDHVDPEAHDRFRGKDGSFKKASKAIRIGVTLGIPMYASIVVSRLNYDVLPALEGYLVDLGASGMNIKRLRPVGNGLTNRAELVLQESQYQHVMEIIPRIKRKSSLDIAFLYEDYPVEGLDEGCPCGRKSLAIKPSGEITPCVYSDLNIGHILEDDLETVWREHPRLKEMRKSFNCLGNDPLGVVRI